MLDRDLPLKKEISANILRLMKEKGIRTQIDLSKISGISKSTLSDYINCKTLINPGNVEKLAQVFNVRKSEIDPSFNTYVASASDNYKIKEARPPLFTKRDEVDIQKNLEKMINDLKNNNSYAAFDGQTLEDMDEEDKELLITSLENSLRVAKKLAKQKFTPNKYRD